MYTGNESGRGGCCAFPAHAGSDFERAYRAAVDTGQPQEVEAYYPAPLEAWYQVLCWPSPDGRCARPGVRAALSTLGAAGSTGITITLAVTYGHDLAALGERTRTAVARGIREHTGLDHVAVDVVIDDVLDAPRW